MSGPENFTWGCFMGFFLGVSVSFAIVAVLSATVFAVVAR